MLPHNTLSVRALYRALGVITFLAAGACHSSTDSSNEPPGQWYAGDFHVHSSVGSNDARNPDGERVSWPQTIADVAQERGLSFVTVTDHSNSAGSVTHTTMEYEDQWNQGPEFPLWATAAALTTPEFLFINGSEISPVSMLPEEICADCSELGDKLEPVGHIGCIPRALDTFDITGHIQDRPPGKVTGKMAVDQCLERDGFAILNHPYSSVAVWLTYDWTSHDYHAIEVWNGSVGHSFMDTHAYDAYLCDRLAGSDVVAVGGSDNHVTDIPYHRNPIGIAPPLGMPMTSVHAENLDWDSIMASVAGGHIVVHDRGTFVSFSLMSGGDRIGGIGDTIRVSQLGDAPVNIRLEGESAVAQDLRVIHVAPGGCEDNRAPFTSSIPEVTRNLIHEEYVCQGNAPCDFTADIHVNVEPGLYYVTLGSPEESALNKRNVAVTNVLTIENN